MSVDYGSEAVWASYADSENDVRRLNGSAEMLPSNISSLLDVGAGHGKFLKILEATRPTLSLFGLERSTAAIDGRVCTTEIQAGSADELPFADHEFDAVSVLELIEHLPCGIFEKALKEIERVASRFVLLSVPYAEQRYKVRCPYCSTDFHPWGHLRSFDEVRLESLFRNLRVRETRIITSTRRLAIPTPLPALRRLRDQVATMPERVVCPACNFRSISESCQPKKSGVAEMLRGMLPTRVVPTWIVVLYERSH